MVDRCRLRVDPLGASAGKIPCGPFQWTWDQAIAKLDVDPHTTAAWFYPLAVGVCRVTVRGGKRESTITVAGEQVTVMEARADSCGALLAIVYRKQKPHEVSGI
jgi:hypothetical protein